MKIIEIFRTGRQTASSGEALSFTEADLKASASAYDPTLHEAPIVVGHPRDNSPAYGWIKGISFLPGGTLNATPHQVEPAFAEMVSAGRFKKRSASFYRPDSPANPVPGVYYLRHVGFLGAQAPAVKGLKDPEFHDNPDDVVEFADSTILATMLRNLREFLVEKYGLETADNTLPGYLVESVEADARKDLEQEIKAGAPADEFTEPKEIRMTPEEIEALKAKAAKADEFEAQAAQREKQDLAFTEREKALTEREATARRAQIEAEINQHVQAGRLLPAQREGLAEFMESLCESGEIEYAEGKETRKLTPREYLNKFISTLPKAIQFGEFSADNGADPDALDSVEFSERAKRYVESQRALGRHPTTIEVAHAVRDGNVQ